MDMDRNRLFGCAAFAISIATLVAIRRLRQESSQPSEAPTKSVAATGMTDSSLITVPVGCSSKAPAVESQNAVCVSAPGKVLIAGGYLVLEHPNVGVTVATTARFYTSVRTQLLRNTNLIQQQQQRSLLIEVLSPQFHTSYKYVLNIDDVAISALPGSEANEFVSKCLLLTMSFLQQHIGSAVFTERLFELSLDKKLEITLRADNDFYSQISELQKRGLPRTSESLRQLPKFIPCPKDSSGAVQIAKTGLGSSAALTTSLVGALLQWFKVIDLTAITTTATTSADDTAVAISEAVATDIRIVHNLAQLVHANAQGKIGSGFDVASAVYGTHLYRRFSATAFAACLEERVLPATIHRAVLQPNCRNGWSQTIEPFLFPVGMNIVLGDVCGGSSSTSMARKVLAWRKADAAAADQLWVNLSHTNSVIFSCIERLNNQCAMNRSGYLEAIEWAAERTSTDWQKRKQEAVISLLLELRALLRSARNYLKLMGDAAGVGIEPDAQTTLADATSALPGVVGAAVPGAGGVDALFAIVLSAAARERVELLWSGSRDGAAVCPLMLSAGSGAAAGIAAHDPELIN